MELSTSRPRVLGWLRSAAILDGDWGTSVAYVLGIAFFHAGYYSGWHIMMMIVFTIMIAINYITICRIYPAGGGVYSSVSHRSKTLAVVGGLMLTADYVVTASLSVLDAFHYFHFTHPEIWAIGAILCIGILNWFGPKHAGSASILISSVVIVAIFILIIFVLPKSVLNIRIEPHPGGIWENWNFFVAIILSISGIEAISNMTGVMKDPIKSSRKAILSVLTKNILIMAILGSAMLVIPNLSRVEHKEEMIRYLGEYYIGDWFGPIIGFALGFLLISAGNTAINAFTSIQFMMSVDGELPRELRKLNKYGVPVIPLIISTAIPIIVLILIHDVITLASLYAIGVVGAIMINIGSTGTDREIKLSKGSRMFMIASSIFLFLIEATIAVQKTKALIFVLSVLLLGLGAREFARRRRVAVAPTIAIPTIPSVSIPRTETTSFTSRMMVAVSSKGQQLLRQACEDAKLRNAFLFVIHVKEISVSGVLPEKLSTEAFVNNRWMVDICQEYKIPYRIITVLSNEIAYTIAENAATFGVDRLILGATQRGLVTKALRGDVIRRVSELLPEEIQLLIYRA